MNIIIFEDLNTDNLNPFSINHASFEMKCGLYTNLERIVNNFNEDLNIHLVVRDELKELIQERFPQYEVNPNEIHKGICLNGAVVWDDKLIKKVMKDSDSSFSSSGNIIAFKNNINSQNIRNSLNQKLNKSIEVNANYISYIWECIDLFKSIIVIDIKNLDNKSISEFNDVVMLNKNQIFKDNTSIIESGSILDASKGPIILAENVLIESGAILKGPLFIDKNSIISNGSKLKGNILIGPNCKIGGEVTNTIFHGYTNKVHDGFLGDSYIGEWVNIGANTNNSNLKNNYSSIKFNFPRQTIDTKRTFLGVMIGDFTRLGISTMINTGSYFGLGCNIFGSGFQDKHIESFAWGRDSIVDFEKLIETIKLMKDRRSKKLTKIEIKLLKNLYLKIKK